MGVIKETGGGCHGNQGRTRQDFKKMALSMAVNEDEDGANTRIFFVQSHVLLQIQGNSKSNVFINFFRLRHAQVCKIMCVSGGQCFWQVCYKSALHPPWVPLQTSPHALILLCAPCLVCCSFLIPALPATVLPAPSLIHHVPHTCCQCPLWTHAASWPFLV